jgi:hypothetical protein
MDKLTKTKQKERVAELTRDLKLDSEQIVPFSVVSGAGRELLLEAIVSLLGPEDVLE